MLHRCQRKYLTALIHFGADDYIAKPFLPQEFLLRVYAVLRRCYKEDSGVLKLDACTVDFSRAEVDKGGEILPLTAMEHRLLETLAKNEGRIVTFQQKKEQHLCSYAVHLPDRPLLQSYPACSRKGCLINSSFLLQIQRYADQKSVQF